MTNSAESSNSSSGAASASKMASSNAGSTLAQPNDLKRKAAMSVAEKEAEREAKRQAKKKKDEDDFNASFRREREQRYERVDILGLIIGDSNERILARSQLPDGFTGPCNTWISIHKDGNVWLGFAPKHWKGGEKFAAYNNIIYNNFNLEYYKNKLRTKRELADALSVAESGQFPDKKISRLEGVLAANFFQVRKVAKAYLIHVGLLDAPAGVNINWPVDSQARGVAILKDLRSAYGSEAFESGEVVALAAGHLRALPDLPDWFDSDPRYIDVYLCKFHTRALKKDGPRMKNRLLTTHEFAHDFVPLDQGQFDNSLRTINKGVVKLRMLGDVMNISPIAVRLLQVHPDDKDPSVHPEAVWDPPSIGSS